jgi:ELWxxDGT repeat protein
MLHSAKLVVLAALFIVTLQSYATPQKVYEVNPALEQNRTDSLSPSQYISSGHYLFFLALNNPVEAGSLRPAYHKKAIWRLDTRDNTTSLLVDDLSYLTTGENGAYQVLDNSIIYFSDAGLTIASLDGKEKQLIADLKDVWLQNDPGKIINFNGQVYFAAQSQQSGKIGLWRTNGTVAGTVEVPVCAEGCYEAPRQMVVSGNKLFLVRSDTNGLSELWTVNSQNNATLVKDVILSPTNNSQLRAYDNGVQFNSPSGDWFSDGTSHYQIKFENLKTQGIATEVIKFGNSMLVAADELYSVSNNGRGASSYIDIATGLINGVEAISTPRNLIAFKGVIYFTVNLFNQQTGLSNSKLMIFDGSAEVKEIFTFESLPYDNLKILGNKGNKLILSRYIPEDYYAGTGRTELWVSDGTTAGTVKISDSGVPVHLWNSSAWKFLGNELYFSGYSAEEGIELWRSDATTEGTLLAKDVAYGIARKQLGKLVGDGQNLYYQIEHKWSGSNEISSGIQRSLELWTTDIATMRSKKIEEWQDSASQLPREMIAATDGAYWWEPNTETAFTQDLKFYNRNTKRVTTVLTEVNETCFGQPEYDDRVTLTVDNSYYFQAPVTVDGVAVCQLWVSDGTTSGTRSLTQFPNVFFNSVILSNILLFQDEVYFSLRAVNTDAKAMRTTVYKTDGTPEGTTEVFNPVAADNTDFLAVDTMLATDNGIFLFLSNNEQQLWHWTPTGLQLLKSFSATQRAYDIVRFKNGIAFISGDTIYLSDGSVAGTIPAISLANANEPIEWARLAATPDLQQLIYTFKASNNQINLWRSDATDAGTVMLEQDLPHYSFSIQAQLSNDLYIRSNATLPDYMYRERLKRFSLVGSDSEELFSLEVHYPLTGLNAYTSQDKVFLSGQSKHPDSGGPYVTAKLDSGDADKDGALNSEDVFPFHPDEQLDNDLDGLGNNADTDDDGDQVPDQQDAFPLNALEWADHDQDGTGNAADTDDDGDTVSDWLDSYPRDAARSSNNTAGGTDPNPPVVLPVPEENSGSSGGSIQYFAIYLLLCVAFRLKVQRQNRSRR